MQRHATKLISQLKRPFVYGMIHVPALPGAPLNRLGIAEIRNIVRHEAKIYKDSGIDGIIVENMWDIPYVKKEASGPEVVAAMAISCEEVTNVFGSKRDAMSLGIQILAGCNEEAIAVANATGFDLIRAEGFVFASVADEGWIDGCAGPLLRYRKKIGADDVAVFCDIKKKHSSHSVTADISVGEAAKAAEFFEANGLIVTGTSTGQTAKVEEVEEARSASSLPILIGSGVSFENMERYKTADAFIVGTDFKKDRHWRNELSADMVKRFMEKARKLV